MSDISKKAQSLLTNLENKSATRDTEKIRQSALEDIESGAFAQKFNQWVINYARTEKDIKVIAEPWVEQWNLVNGDLRLNEVVISGAAQVFKSLGSYLLAYYATEKGYLNGLYCFAKASIRDKIVGSTVKPIWRNNNYVTPNALTPVIENNKQYQTEGYTLYTSFVNNPTASDSVEVPVELASISVDFMMLDEYQNYKPELAAVLRDRQNNSALESRPVRKISTPGAAGTGIEVELNECSHLFEAHVVCQHCGKLASLNPYDCFLKPVMLPGADGEERLTYFDDEMRVQDWNYHDPEDKINTAYLACHHCHEPIEQSHLRTALLYDRKTKKSVEDLIDEVNSDPWRIRKIGLIASPFLRRVKSSIAARFANDALTTKNPTNFLQQTLGLPTSDEFSGLTIDMLRGAIEAQKQPANPKEYVHHTVLGGDIARSSHYFCVMDAYIPVTGTKEDRHRNTIRSVRSYERASSYGFDTLWRKHKIDFGAVDYNPDADLVLGWSKKYNIIGCIQKHGLTDMFKEEKEYEAGGVLTKAYSFNNQWLINIVVRNFKNKSLINPEELIMRLPSSFKSELEVRTSASPLSHLLGIEFNEEKQMWTKPSTGTSRIDFFYATLFAEAAIYHKINFYKDMSWLKFFV